MANKWYRKKTWTEADQADFRTRLCKAREENKPQYLRIQAGTLEASGAQYLLSAITLLNEVIEAHPQSLEVATALGQKGACLRRLGDIAGSANTYAAAIHRMRSVPKMQSQAAWQDYGLLVATERLSARYTDALEVLDQFSGASPLMLPADWFRVHASRAMILIELRRKNEAAEEASAALNAMKQIHSGVAYHPSIGLVADDDLELRERLLRILDDSEQASQGERRRSITKLLRRK